MGPLSHPLIICIKCWVVVKLYNDFSFVQEWIWLPIWPIMSLSLDIHPSWQEDILEVSNNIFLLISSDNWVFSSISVQSKYQFSFSGHFLPASQVYPWYSPNPWLSQIFWFLEGVHEFLVQLLGPYQWLIHSSSPLDWPGDPPIMQLRLGPSLEDSEHVKALSGGNQLCEVMKLSSDPWAHNWDLCRST